jgi:hypothetical protein
MRDGAAFEEFPRVGRLLEPERWLTAYGYPGRCRYVALWWECAGDEAAYSDGYSSLCGAEWPLLLEMAQASAWAISAAVPGDPRGRHVIGSSEEPGTHWLLLDRQSGEIRIGLENAVREFLQRHNRIEDAPIPKGLWETLKAAGWVVGDPPADEEGKP